jgi:hypothetical protein
MQAQDSAGLPSARHRVHGLVQVSAESLAAAEGKAVDRVADEVMRGIVVARSPTRYSSQ